MINMDTSNIISLVACCLSLASLAWSVHVSKSKEIQEFQVKIAVLEERLNSEIALLSKLEEKINIIKDRLQ